MHHGYLPQKAKKRFFGPHKRFHFSLIFYTLALTTVMRKKYSLRASNDFVVASPAVGTHV
jgi:hypothetical protein